ncbi:hypothetical protein [Nocardia sp. NBC_01388]|uniref:hypothetical protein n=1 Tax=Nocardia sp. NBC_01388 TaxID=2903596 RepID=UPI0032476765
MSLILSYNQDPGSGQWTVSGDDGVKSVTVTHQSRDEAAAQVQEALGFRAFRPPPPLPLGWHRFVLIDSLIGSNGAAPDDPRYDAIKAALPQGCTVGDFAYSFGLECDRPGGHLLDAIAATCAELREAHGLFLADVGVEKVDEWVTDGKDGWGARILAQLLLMSVERARLLGYSADDLISFIRRAS